MEKGRCGENITQRQGQDRVRFTKNEPNVVKRGMKIDIGDGESQWIGVTKSKDGYDEQPMSVGCVPH